ncbi:MAG: hypothetical protein J6I56_04055 [Lachnospiraceae bacterium]|nr:hypothetical protein [Lachnospiraceae bacterium]
MYCYQCGYELNPAKNTCPQCGADVSQYKHIVYFSNHYYNEGLEKAKARNLSGAVASLRQSLRFYKENIDARNLLGLIYFELGEIAPALCEWVISCNIKEQDNLAADYIALLKNNQNKLDNINQTVKKYNQSLDYCDQGSLDLAVIQLRKALSVNPRFLRARQLLALLYMNAKDYAGAARELGKCHSIDGGNTTTLRYIREVEQLSGGENTVTYGVRKGTSPKEESVTYTSGNETIIQPAGRGSFGMDTGFFPGGLIHLAIGALIGAAVVGFLVMPARIQSARALAAQQIRTISEQADARNTQIAEKERTIESLNEENEALRTQLSAFTSSEGDTDIEVLLKQAAARYLNDPSDTDSVLEVFTQIDPVQVNAMESEPLKDLYEALSQRLRMPLRTYYYDLGLAALEAETPDIDAAVKNLEASWSYTREGDENFTSNIFYLAEAYYRQYATAQAAAREELTDHLIAARAFFRDVVNLHPLSQHVEDAQNRLNDIAALGVILDG